MEFDAIVVGSGITGGWAAKELTEAGLKVLLLERGREIRHQQDYATEMKAPWDMTFRGVGDADRYAREYPVQMLNRHFTEYTEGHFVNDADNLADQSALGHHRVALGDLGQHGLVFLHLLLLRADEEEVENAHDQNERQDHADKIDCRRPCRGLGKGLGNEHQAVLHVGPLWTRFKKLR